MNTSHITRFALLVISLFSLLSFTCSAHAAAQVHIKNCAGEKMLVCTFNGRDVVMMIEADFKRLPDGDSSTLQCAEEQGKGGCRVKAVSRHTSDCGQSYGTTFSGRHKGYFLLFGEGYNDLKEVTESQYKDANACN